MNLTGQAPYQKYHRGKRKSRSASKRQRDYWALVVGVGCIIEGCQRRPGIHHAETGAGGRKYHWKVLPLCHHHHQGDQGIHTISRKKWEAIFGTEQYLMSKLTLLLTGTRKNPQ